MPFFLYLVFYFCRDPVPYTLPHPAAFIIVKFEPRADLSMVDQSSPTDHTHSPKCSHLCFRDRVSHYSPGYPRSHCITQPDLVLRAMFLP